MFLILDSFIPWLLSPTAVGIWQSKTCGEYVAEGNFLSSVRARKLKEKRNWGGDGLRLQYASQVLKCKDQFP